jgi:acetyl-CoA carboxylase carboxyl transferase subunit beta
MLADVTMAEPGALIGFAGPRVIEGTIRQTLPEGFQRAEFQVEKGFVDLIVKRSDQRHVISELIDLHSPSGEKK